MVVPERPSGERLVSGKISPRCPRGEGQLVPSSGEGPVPVDTKLRWRGRWSALVPVGVVIVTGGPMGRAAAGCPPERPWEMASLGLGFG
jgi:hypothetical protein